MARKVFFSFHYKPDNWRAATVRSIGSIEGNRPASDNDWEDVTENGPIAIQAWIDNQLNGKSCVVVLVGAATAGRKWINYEIKKGWNDGKGVVGIRIHNLLNSKGEKASYGSNPFSEFNVDGTDMARIVKLYNPSGDDSKEIYSTIANNIANWVDEAVAIRADYE